MLLYVEPQLQPTRAPVLDGLTRKMTAAFRAGRPEGRASYGIHVCRCGAESSNRDFILPSGLTTNSLCVHYLAHHRAEVPPSELEKVARLDQGEVRPRKTELSGARWSTGIPRWWEFWR